MSALPPPDPLLEACVVVPARDEEQRIAACIDALAAQRGVAPEAWELIVVLDECTDSTEARVSEAVAATPLRLRLLRGPGRGSGGARALGMDAAHDRLMAAGRPDGLIASTDADSQADPDWLARQIELARSGVRAIGGRITMCETERAGLPAEVLAGHTERSRLRFAEVLEREPGARVIEHWQFSGASMAVTAATYAAVGGLGDWVHSEDEQLERKLRAHGVPIERHLGVRVTTSARLDGRAERGLAQVLSDLAADQA